MKPIDSPPPKKPKNESPLRNPWIWGMIGMGVAVVAANGFLLHFSISSSPGLVVPDFYERGQNYPERARNRRQTEIRLGWELKLISPEQVKVGERGTFQATILSREGNPVQVDRAELFLFRPSNDKEDFSRLMEKNSHGGYQADIRFPKRGLWDLLLEVENTEGRVELARRIHVS